MGFTNPYFAVKAIIENKPTCMDAMEIKTSKSGKVIWDLHTFNWGTNTEVLVELTFTAWSADVDYILEKELRWMPKVAREVYASIKIILANRTYHPKLLTFEPVHQHPAYISKHDYNDVELLPVWGDILSSN